MRVLGRLMKDKETPRMMLNKILENKSFLLKLTSLSRRSFTLINELLQKPIEKEYKIKCAVSGNEHYSGLKKMIQRIWQIVELR